MLLLLILMIVLLGLIIDDCTSRDPLVGYKTEHLNQGKVPYSTDNLRKADDLNMSPPLVLNSMKSYYSYDKNFNSLTNPLGFPHEAPYITRPLTQDVQNVNSGIVLTKPIKSQVLVPPRKGKKTTIRV